MELLFEKNEREVMAAGRCLEKPSATAAEDCAFNDAMLRIAASALGLMVGNVAEVSEEAAGTASYRVRAETGTGSACAEFRGVVPRGSYSACHREREHRTSWDGWAVVAIPRQEHDWLRSQLERRVGLLIVCDEVESEYCVSTMEAELRNSMGATFGETLRLVDDAVTKSMTAVEAATQLDVAYVIRATVTVACKEYDGIHYASAEASIEPFDARGEGAGQPFTTQVTQEGFPVSQKEVVHHVLEELSRKTASKIRAGYLGSVSTCPND
jgi:hypothetical protein